MEHNHHDCIITVDPFLPSPSLPSSTIQGGFDHSHMCVCAGLEIQLTLIFDENRERMKRRKRSSFNPQL